MKYRFFLWKKNSHIKKYIFVLSISQDKQNETWNIFNILITKLKLLNILVTNLNDISYKKNVKYNYNFQKTLNKFR